MRAATRLFARTELRRRWPALVLLALLTAMIVAVVTAGLLGASRARSAFHRLRAATHASDAFVSDTTAADMRARSGVVGAADVASPFLRPVGSPRFPGYNMWVLVPADKVDQPVITSGRAIDPQQVEEVVFNSDLAGEVGAHVGDVVPLETMTPAWLATAENGTAGPADGPVIQARLVGIGRSPADLGANHWIIFVSPRLVDAYPDQIAVHRQVAVRVQPGADPQNVLADTQADPAPFAANPAADSGLGTLATALRLVALAGGLGGALALAVTLSRQARQTMADDATLRAVGWSTGQMVRAGTLVVTPALAVGLLIGAVGGSFASLLTVTGLAARADPTPHRVLLSAPTLVAVGFGGVVVLLSMAAIAHRSALRRRPAVAPRAALRPLRPLPVWLGVQQALVGRGRDGGRASRSAIAAAGVGVGASIAALVVGASIGRLQHTPALYGQNEHQAIDSGGDPDLYNKALQRLAGDAQVRLLAGIRVNGELRPPDGQDMTTLIVDLRRGQIDASLLDGHMPLQPDQVALGPATLARLGVRVGQTITLAGGGRTAVYTVVGSTLFPQGDFDYDDGAAMTAAGATRLLPDDFREVDFAHYVLFDWAPGVDVAAADRELSAEGLPPLDTASGLQPSVVSNIGQVRVLPRFLAALFAVIAVAGLAHAMLVAIRQRRRELGVLRALGMTTRANAMQAIVQAVTIVGVGVLGGLVLGVAGGREVWGHIAGRAHLIISYATPWRGIVVVAALTGLAAVFAAVLSAWSNNRLSAAAVLHDE